jgi:hypothetical protein
VQERTCLGFHDARIRLRDLSGMEYLFS